MSDGENRLNGGWERYSMQQEIQSTGNPPSNGKDSLNNITIQYGQGTKPNRNWYNISGLVEALQLLKLAYPIILLSEI